MINTTESKPTTTETEAPAAMDNTPDADEKTKTPASTWIKRGLIAAVAAVALGYGAIFFYANVINDSPDALDADDLSDALSADPDEAADDTATDEGDAAAAPDAPAATEPAAEEPAPVEAAGFDGTWVPTTASEFGYRVDEVLGGVNVTAVGRSNEIEGTLTIDGTTASIEAIVQVENIESDDSRRNNAFRTQIMDTANFPTATFATTEPIDFGEIPATGEQVTATAVGELTLKGTTLPVTVEVTAQADADSIGVLGNIPITFTDYGIDNPSNPAVSLEDEGIVEFILVFERGA
ncbi:MAG: YceI family protein [Ilumatobacter sp.]